MKKLFTPFQIGNLLLPNRVIRAAVYEPYCPDGKLSDKFIEIHEELVDGGVGMTTTGFVAVCPEGQISPWQLDMSKHTVDELKPLPDRIHDMGGLISCNLSYCQPGWKFDVVQGEVHDIENFVDKFVDAAILARDSGFDAIELHHFYHTFFLYEELNQRTDEYGGSVENRNRAPREIIKRIRSEVGEDFPIFIKFTMNPSMSPEDCVEIAKGFEAEGASAIISFKTEGIEDHTELYCLDEANNLKENLSIPVIYSCGICTAEQLEDEILEENGFDLVQIGRNLLRDPHFVNKVRDGDDYLECLKCNQCHRGIWDDPPELKCCLE